jgi:diguanylate cyclase (GGDEF)-like protein
MSEIVELGLRRPDEASASLRAFVERLLALLLMLPESASADRRAELQSQVKDLQAELAESTHAQDLRRLAAAALKLCEQYLKRARDYWTTREAEMAEMIAILREAAQTVVGGSSDFHGDLLSGTTRLADLAQLDDIRELKRQLTREVTALQEAIKEKQRRDDETLAHLTERIQTLQSSLDRAEEEASLDPLTKIPNRRAFDRAIARLMMAARQTEKALALAMLDLDHFKAINDTHGHDVGDRVLLCAAQWLTRGLRTSDFVGRYGGEEFVAVLPGATAEQAERRLSVLLAEIAGRRFEYEAGGVTKALRFTLSCGVVQMSWSESAQDLVRRADQALYDAKKKGRNRVVVRKTSRLGAFFGG